MDIGKLRERFPNLVLWGNISCGKVLRLGSVNEVIRETKMCIDKTRGQRHIIGSSNSIISGTPPENVIAMFETAREYSKADSTKFG
jgi:uroporphyrinogen-III decarboxylase